MDVSVKNQVITKHYALYNDDCCEAIKAIKSESIGCSVFSPPFSDLYSYSDADEDMGNCRSYEEFFTHYGFLVEELFRIMLPGRIIAVHCMDLPTHKNKGEELGIRDFPGDIVRLFQQYRFIYHSRHCIWKDPLVTATRTKAIGLAHKQIVKDSSVCRTGIPDYILAFRKPGENPKPIPHPEGLMEYAGARSIPRDLERFIGWKEPKTNKRSHWIWQQYASPVWMDVRQVNVLPFTGGREEDDQKHICPLALDTIERCLVLWSTEDDIVLSPFAGIGSEIYQAVRMGRRGIGIELKRSYFRQMCRNLESLLRKQKTTKGFEY
ncbi:MAG: site-specific DNA-methyltransferase [Patescibacteria group bacterium]|nr:site-specific DNA-methyltransferase [Patescibacteria group bacterium]